jgi:hypothetical protein
MKFVFKINLSMKYLKLVNILVIAALILTIAACANRKTDEYVTSLHFEYFPLEIGRSITYQVDSIVFDSDGQGGFFQDSMRYFLKETFADTFRDAAGNLTFRLERFVRPNADSAWQLQQVWSAQRIDNQSIRTENNLRFLKLIHPIDRRSEWDGTVYLDKNQLIEIAGEPLDLFKGWFSEVDSIDKPRTVGSFTFDSTLVMREADYDDKVDRRFSKEIYAKNVGSVFKELVLLHSKCADEGDLAPCDGKPWREIAGKGFILRMVAIEF